MKKVLRIGGYARVSTDEQKKYGYSIQAQTDEIKQWCNENGHVLQHIYIDEGYSASTMKRPQLQLMLSNLHNLDAIAFTRLDRLSRNVLEANKMLELLHQNNVAMISICEDDINTSTANGLFMFNLKVNLAEHELKKGSERIKAVFDYKIAQGQPITGSLPFGYKIATEQSQKRIIKDSSVSHIVEDTFNHFLKHHSVNKTVKHLNTVHGLKRHYSSVHRMLKNEFYAGVYKGNPDYCEPYISHETYNTIQEMLKTNVRVNTQIYIFSGLIKCHACGSSLSGHSFKADNGVRYFFYRCSRCYSQHLCTNRAQISELYVERFLLANVTELAESHILKITSVKHTSETNTESELKALQSELEKLNYMFLKKRMSVNTYDELYAEIEQKIANMKQNHKQHDNSDMLSKFLNSGWQDIYEKMTKENKRSLWRNLIQQIDVDHEKNISITFR